MKKNTPCITRLDSNIEQLLEFLPDLLQNITEKEDKQILQIAKRAQRLETFAFLVRGICASVLRQRCPNRLLGGRGKKDYEGQGIRAKMSKLAEQLGVNRKTLETDVRIKDTFFQVIDKTSLVNIPCLGREHYVIALAAPDPQAAINIAVEKHNNPDYTLEGFRTYVRELKRDEPTIILDPKTKHVGTVKVLIPEEAQQALLEIIGFNGRSREEVVAEAILNLHRAVFRKRDSKRQHNSNQLTLAI